MVSQDSYPANGNKNLAERRHSPAAKVGELHQGIFVDLNALAGHGYADLRLRLPAGLAGAYAVCFPVPLPAIGGSISF
jgi:hypothetical protein